MRQEFLGTHPLLQPRTAMTDTGVVVTYVRWHCPDEDLYCYEELDGEQWPTRHIEVRRDKTFAAAASLAEVLKAGESGGAAAVSAYRRPGPPARAPVRLPSAQWLLVHGSRLRPLGTGCPSTAVVIEPAHRKTWRRCSCRPTS